MFSAALNAGALGAALLLLAGGLGHLREPRLLKATLRAQRLLPSGLLAPVSLLTPLTELLTGALAIATLLVPGAPGFLLIPQAILYLAFTGYLAVLVRTRPGVPCGCFDARTPASWTTVLRAALAGLLTIAALWARPVPEPWLLPVIAAALLLGLTTWLAPRLR